MLRIKTPLPTNAKRACLVVPLMIGARPFKMPLARTDKMENCLIFDFAILEAHQNLFEKKKYLSFDHMVGTHVATSKKIQLKEMGSFGKGAFSVDTINKDEFIIYAGQLWSDIPLAIDQKIYFFNLYANPKISVDGKYTENLAKYFQHLPTSSKIDEEVATENFLAITAYTTVNYENKKYNLPVLLMRAVREIAPNLILGCDYGTGYWESRKISFTQFTLKGSPLLRFELKVGNGASLQLTTNGARKLLANQMVVLKNKFVFLPADSFSVFKNATEVHSELEKTTRINIPSLAAFESEYGIMISPVDSQSLIFRFSYNPSAQVTFNVSLPFVNSFTKKEKQAIFNIDIDKLLQASIDDLIEFHDFLKLIGEGHKNYFKLYIRLPLLSIYSLALSIDLINEILQDSLTCLLDCKLSHALFEIYVDNLMEIFASYFALVLEGAQPDKVKLPETVPLFSLRKIGFFNNGYWGDRTFEEKQLMTNENRLSA